MEKYIGKKLDGRYEIVELIGFGGMAIVFKAYDLLENRTVAVKILKDEYLDNEEFRRRFRNESKAIAMLSHPNIVRVFDVNFSDAVQYIVMEYIDGITLKEYIGQQGAVKWKETIHFVTQILRALQHAHDNGIVHRDIKPQNIMLLQDGTIKVMDFGIARFARENGRTVTDKAIGSVHYISPEQASGGQTDERTDIYSIGIIMYELLSGSVPFDGETPVAIALKQMQQEPALPTSINPDIPIGLEEITLRAMQKESELRYQSASEMLKDIDEFKMNPDVVFEYKYFNADGTTKYFERPESHIAAAATHKEKQKKKGAYTLSILAGVAAACVILAGVALFFFFSSLNQRTPDVVLENMVGMTVEEAEVAYPNIKIVVTKKETSADFPINQIMIQEPIEGMTVKEGSEVKVVISAGMETIPMPNLLNQPIADAREALAGYEIEEIRRTDTTIAAGNVISTTPAPGENLNAGDTVTIFVSLGSPSRPATVPNLEGLTEVMARNRLIAAGLQLGEVTEVEAEAEDGEEAPEPGTVVKQSIKEGMQVARGTRVDIEIVAKDKPVTIPVTLNFSGKNVANKEFTFEVYVNGTLLSKEKVNPKKAGKFQIELTRDDGKINEEVTEQDNNELVIKVNGKEIAVASLNFDDQSYSLGKTDYSPLMEEESSKEESSKQESSTTPESSTEQESSTTPESSTEPESSVEAESSAE